MRGKFSWSAWWQVEGWLARHPLIFIGGVVVALAILGMLSPVPQREEALAPSDERARVYFGERESVGQMFQPLPNLQEVRVQVGGQGDLRGPLILHLREDYFGQDIRTAIVFSLDPESENAVFRLQSLGGQSTTFRFDPLSQPLARLIWVLEAPNGPRRGYWVYREQDASAYPAGTALLAGKEVFGNFAFTQVGSQPAYREWKQYMTASIEKWEWQSLSLFVVAAAGFAILSPYLKGLSLSPAHWVVTLMILTLVLHVWRSFSAPVIIDEGAYLQDAFQSRSNFLPFRDFLTKGPVYVLLLKIWRALVPDVLAGWRLLSAISWVAVVGVGALLARRFSLPGSVQVAAAALLALLPGVVSASTPLLLQVTSTLFAVLAIVSLLTGAQEGRRSWVVLGSLLMMAGYLTRASTIAAGVAGVVVLLLFSQRRWRDLAVYLAVGVTAIAVISGLALLVMDQDKVAIMLNIEAITVGKIQTANVGGVEPVIRWVTEASTVLWRAGSWVLAGIVWLPLLLSRSRGVLQWILTGLWVAIVAISIYHLIDIDYGLPRALPVTRFTMLGIVFGIPGLWLLKSFLFPVVSTPSRVGWKWIAVCVSWLVALVLLYRGWGIFRPSYVVEFLPPAAMLAAVGLVWGLRELFQRSAAHAVLAGLVLMSWWQGVGVVFHYPISGTMTPRAIEEMTYLLQREVPAEEEIFTAQPAVTAAAKRKIIRGYAHPGWIRAARLGGVPDSLRKIYFAEDGEITRWLQNEVRFVVTDERTSEIYFDDFSERQKILLEKFELIGEVQNELTEEPFRLYRRR